MSRPTTARPDRKQAMDLLGNSSDLEKCSTAEIFDKLCEKLSGLDSRPSETPRPPSPILPHPDLKACLKKMKFQPATKEIVVARDDELAAQTLKTLVRAKILSCPVVDKDDVPLGFIDLSDLTSIVVGLVDTAGNMEAITNAQIYNTKFMKMTAKEAMDKSERNKYHIKQKYITNVLDVVSVMTVDRARRVAIVDGHKKISQVITQTQIMSLLFDEDSPAKEVIVPYRTKRIIDAGLDGHTPVCIKGSDKTVTAFKIMHEKSIGSVGVVDDDGKLTGVITTRDLRGLFSEVAFESDTNLGHDFSRLYTSADKFVTEMREAKESTTKDKIITITGEDTIQKAVDLLREHKIHHLFVVDENGKATSAVTLHELLSVIVNQAKQQ